MGTEEHSAIRGSGENLWRREKPEGEEIRGSGKKMEDTLLLGKMRISLSYRFLRRISLLVRQ